MLTVLFVSALLTLFRSDGVCFEMSCERYNQVLARVSPLKDWERLKNPVFLQDVLTSVSGQKEKCKTKQDSSQTARCLCK